MPSIADLLTDPSQAGKSMWRLLTSMPEDAIVADQLGPHLAGVNDLGWTGSEVQRGDLGDLAAYSVDVQTDKATTGGTTAYAAALIYVGPPEILVGVVELRGGYALGPGDSLAFNLSGIVPTAPIGAS
jgi:hypothetical protein